MMPGDFGASEYPCRALTLQLLGRLGGGFHQFCNSAFRFAAFPLGHRARLILTLRRGTQRT